jgi:hypothetical protein
MTAPSIDWRDLIRLMSGPDRPVPSLRGEVFIRDVDRFIDGNEDAVELSSLGDVVDVLDAGRYLAVESHLAVESSRSRLRVGGTDGTMCFVWGKDTVWTWGSDGTVCARPRDYGRVGSPVSELVTRRELDEWDGDDFTHPASSPAARTFLGRPAWEVTLLPPDRKPHPLTMVIDARTGMILSERNDAFTSVIEWTDLEVDVELDDERFTHK